MRATRKLTLHKVLLVTSTLYLYLNTVHAGLFCPSYVGNYDYHFVLEIYDVPPECLENNNIIYSLDSAGVIKCSNNTECKTSTDVADSYEVWFKKLGRPNGLQYNLTYPSTANVTLPLGTYQTVWTCGRHQYNHSCTVRTGVEEDECDFCLHNTYCEDLPVGYQCLCEDGYSGINCSQGDQRLYCNYTDIFYSTYAHACSDPKALDCYVAGQTLSQPLQFNLDKVQFNVSFLMTNQSANISICVPESAVIGNYTFIGTIEAETREKFDLTFDVYLMSVFLNVPESGYYLFNVSEDVSVNDKVVNVSKTPCSDCIQIVDNKKTENIHFFDTVWDDAITLDKNTFIVTRPLKAPNVVMKKLKAAVGQLDYGSINVTFQVTDVDEPPSCNETEIDIEISLPGDSVDTLDVHLNCSDPDVEAKFKVINYSVDPNYESFFSVNEDGILRVTSSLAYLAPGLHHFNITLNKDYKDDRFRTILQISLTIRDPTQESGDTTVPTEQEDTTETTEPMSTTTTVSDTLRNTTLFYYPTPSASSWSTQSTPTLTPEVSQISESPLITPTATVSLNSVYTTSSDSQMPSTLVVDPTSTPVVTSTLPPENCIPETVVLTQTLAQKNKTIYNISCSQSGVVGLELLSSGEAGDAVQLIGTSIFLSKELPNTLANFTIIVAVKFVGRSDNYSTTFLLACPETREPDGVIFSQAWPETLHTEACPTGYSGTISRWCTKDATWEPYNITSCTRGVDKALNMLDQLNSSSLNMSLVKEIIKLADPQKPVNNSEDFKNLLTILNRLSITFKDSDAPLDFDSFQQIANITDQLVSGDDNVWLNERSGQDQAAQLMESFERMATASLKSLNKTGEITLTTSKLGITLNVLAKNITYDSTQSQGWVNEAKNKISYDPLDAGSLNYSIILYRNLADHVRLNQSLQEKFEESKGLVNKTFNSYIISISVSQGQISKPISITFSLVQNNYSKPACGFLNTSNSLESFWSTSGCTVTAFSESQVTCTCNHLTNFAVLMSPFGNLIDTEALSYISIIGCSISLFCLTLTVIIYIVLWKYLKNDRSVLHLNLSVCLMIGYIVFLAGVRSTENRVGCIVVAALLHYFFLAVFFMMLAEGVEIIKSVSFVFTSRSIIGYLLLGAYGIPLIIVGVSLAVTQTEGYGNDKYCWLSTSSGLIWAFVGPVLLIFLANLIILIIVLRTMQTSRIIKDKSVPDRVKSAIRSICILSPILGLAWIFGVLSVNEASQVFTYLFAIFNSLQGLFIFIFQCLLQHQVKDAMKEKRRKYKVQNSVDSGQKLVSSNSSVRGTQSQSNTTTKSTSEGVFDYPLFPNAVYKDAKNESNTVYKDAKNGNKNEVTRGQDATEAANMAIKEDNYMNYDLAYAGTPYKNSDPMVFPNYGFSFSEMDLDDFKSNNQIVEIDGNSIRSKESWQARSRRRKQGLDENAEIEKERLKHVYGDVQAVRRLPQNSVPENSQLRAKERWKQLQLLAKSTQKSKDRDSIPETKEDIFMAPQLGALVDSYKHNNPKKSRPQLPPLVIPRPNAGHSLSPGYHSHI
ncbi:adhesion G-protein coupled receptor G6-like isoform X2 [Biomphalaria glabrata]|uniref:Adhesion G-protein coupled receptor G6-like isoform X2 n=1 Tax=Biomphalaria glabrata TaxID=6526 RepID=A0A9W3AK01_BIOGL|nr:adhesion G-protein coupled receptor G6-like isoform X2 [Biomphalaria glabrata]